MQETHYFVQYHDAKRWVTHERFDAREAASARAQWLLAHSADTPTRIVESRRAPGAAAPEQTTVFVSAAPTPRFSVVRNGALATLTALAVAGAFAGSMFSAQHFTPAAASAIAIDIAAAPANPCAIGGPLDALCRRAEADPAARYDLALALADLAPAAGVAERAFDAMRGAAIGGPTPAYRALAEAYEHGAGVAADAERALRWYHTAAAAGDAQAALELGRIYETGRLGAVDARLAVAFYLEAAEAGDVVAMREAGRLLRDTASDESERALAARWLQSAAAAPTSEPRFAARIDLPAGAERLSLGRDRDAAEDGPAVMFDAPGEAPRPAVLTPAALIWTRPTAPAAPMMVDLGAAPKPPPITIAAPDFAHVAAVQDDLARMRQALAGAAAGAADERAHQAADDCRLAYESVARAAREGAYSADQGRLSWAPCAAAYAVGAPALRSDS